MTDPDIRADIAALRAETAALRKDVDRQDQALQEIERTQEQVVKSLSAVEARMDGQTSIGEVILSHTARLSERMDALREIFSAHEAREEDKWRADLQYRQARDDAEAVRREEERRQRRNEYWALAGVTCTILGGIIGMIISLHGH